MRRIVERLFTFANLTVVLVTLTSGLAQQENAASVAYTIKDGILEGPEQLEAGFHYFTIDLDLDEGWVDGSLLRLQENVTAEEALQAMRSVDEAFESEDADPLVALNTLLEKVDILGGPSQHQRIGVYLEPGNYVFTANIGNNDGPLSLVSKPLEVVSSSTPTPTPQVDLTVNMVDFAFTLPDEVKAGEQVWEVANRGEQLHHISLAIFKPGKTMEDAMAFVENQQGEPPADEVFHLSPISPGGINYVALDLEPGAYIALCFIPDHAEGATGQPHIALGMMSAFIVADE